jgi:hypothetical protein
LRRKADREASFFRRCTLPAPSTTPVRPVRTSGLPFHPRRQTTCRTATRCRTQNSALPRLAGRRLGGPLPRLAFLNSLPPYLPWGLLWGRIPGG